MSHIQRHEGIELFATIGVYEWEREAVRPLVFDLQLSSEWPLNLDRAEITRRLSDWLIPCRYRLLEAQAEYLAQCMLRHWACSRIVLGIEKPGALGELARVGIRIVRTR